MTNPKTFASNLKHSTLDPDDKLALLEILPFLNAQEIKEISKTLEEDVHAQEKYMRRVDLKINMLLQKFDNGYDTQSEED